MADASVNFAGWNSITQGWGDAGWGQDASFVGATASVGSVTVSLGTGVNVSVSGLAATSAVGSVAVNQGDGANVSLTGFEINATAGNTTESAGGGISVGVTGGGVTLSLSGILIWGEIDTTQPSPAPEWTPVNTSQTPTWTEIAA
jgi:hypothetical protein